MSYAAGVKRSHVVEALGRLEGYGVPGIQSFAPHISDIEVRSVEFPVLYSFDLRRR